MSRQKNRENAIIYVYQMLLKASVEIEDILGDEELLTDEFQPVVHSIMTNIRSYRETLDKQLIDWEFERLGFVEQAILLLALAETEVLATPKSVVIDEAINFAKEYGDDDTFKLINATLDKVL